MFSFGYLYNPHISNIVNLGDEDVYPDESCESVLVNGISVLLAILETRKAVSNSFVNNDYLDPCGTGKTHFTAKAKFPHKNTNLLYEIT